MTIHHRKSTGFITVFFCLITPQEFYPFNNCRNLHPLFWLVHQLIVKNVEIGGSKNESPGNSRRCIIAIFIETLGCQALRLSMQGVNLAVQLPAGEFFVAALVKDNHILR